MTLVTAKRQKLLWCVYMRARESGYFTTFLHFVTCGWCVLNFCCSVEFVFAAAGASKTTRRFVESDVLFYRKWRVVLWKTTCCFIESDVLFYRKWRVVLWKTTCCFVQSELSFLVTSSQCLAFSLFTKRQKEMPQKWVLQHFLYWTNEVNCIGARYYPQSVIRPLLCSSL